MGEETIKSTCLHLHLYLLFFSVTKFEAVTPHRKFWFVSYVEHFEAVHFLFLANFLLSLQLNFFEFLNYFVFCGPQGEVEGITVGQSRDI